MSDALGMSSLGTIWALGVDVTASGVSFARGFWAVHHDRRRDKALHWRHFLTSASAQPRLFTSHVARSAATRLVHVETWLIAHVGHENSDHQ